MDFPDELVLVQKLVEDTKKIKEAASTIRFNVAGVTLASHLALEKRPKEWISDGRKMLKTMESKFKARQSDFPSLFMNRFNDAMQEKQSPPEAAPGDVPIPACPAPSEDDGSQDTETPAENPSKKRKLAGAYKKK